MASAALPFGIVPSIAVCGRTCVDGGVADNTPVFPFMNDDSIDEIYVVLLEPVQHLKDVRALIGATREAWSRRDRDLRVAAFEHPSPIWKDEPRPYRVREQPPKHIPLRPLNHLPEIKVFSPERSLGSTLSGTLNFDGKYAERLIERGLRETEAALDRITAKESLR
jgi:predicted acylesterase/phospholipase RssA